MKLFTAISLVIASFSLPAIVQAAPADPVTQGKQEAERILAGDSAISEQTEEIHDATGRMLYKCQDPEKSIQLREKIQEQFKMQADNPGQGPKLDQTTGEAAQATQDQAANSYDQITQVLMFGSEDFCLCEPMDPKAFGGVVNPMMLCEMQKGQIQRVISAGQAAVQIGDTAAQALKDQEDA